MKRIQRRCKICGVMKHLDHYYPIAGGKRRRSCKPCFYRKQREYHDANRERRQTILKAWNLKTKYGLSLEEYDRMSAANDGRCAICNKSVDLLLVDHDHATGRVRGLLCKTCNWGLGQFYDNPTLLMKAVEYLA